MHYLEDPNEQNSRTFVGSYDYGLVVEDNDWKINKFKFNRKFIVGNINLESKVN